MKRFFRSRGTKGEENKAIYLGSRRCYTFLVATVGFSQESNASSTVLQDSWTIDLFEVGFGQVIFEPSALPPNSIQFFSAWSNLVTGMCTISYGDCFDKAVSLENQAVALSFETTMSRFVDGLFECGYENNFVQKLDRSDIVEAWVAEYKQRCGDLSFNRVGWVGDPETGFFIR